MFMLLTYSVTYWTPRTTLPSRASFLPTSLSLIRFPAVANTGTYRDDLFSSCFFTLNRSNLKAIATGYGTLKKRF